MTHRSALVLVAALAVAGCRSDDGAGSDDADDPAAFAEAFCPSLVGFFGALDTIGEEADDVEVAAEQISVILDATEDMAGAARGADVTPEAARWRTDLVAGLDDVATALDGARDDLDALGDEPSPDEITEHVLDRVEGPFAAVFAPPPHSDGDGGTAGVLYEAPEEVLDALGEAPGCRRLLEAARQGPATTTTVAPPGEGATTTTEREPA